MNNAQILRNHALFQKSWTNWPCNHGLPSLSSGSRTSRATGSESLEMSLATSSKSGNSQPRFRTNRVESTSTFSKSDPSSLTASNNSVVTRGNHVLADRREKRATRRKPWTEDIPKIESNKNTYVEIHYEKALPKGKWMEYRQRQYVANPKYGHLYEVRTDLTPRRESPPPPSTWLWEDEYRIWRLEEAREGNSSVSSSLSKIGSMTSRKGKRNDKEKPHADLFAQYHAYRLDKQRRQYAATNIQRYVKGWLVRHKVKKLKRNALLGLSRAWPKFTDEYKETVTRIQARYGVMRTYCHFDLDQVEDFIDRRERYERVFDRMVDRRIEKMPRDDLPEFFRACGLHPTEGEINAAFNTIFRGAGNTAEVVFVLDCSASLGPVNFKCQLNFLKDVIRDLDVASDRIRVGLVPYTESVFESFGLTRFENKKDILERIDQIKFKSGLTRTDLALKMMRELFQSSRPGVQKVCLVITDGKSHDVNLTLREARKAQQDNIDIYTIGVGYDVDVEELKSIASSDKNVHTVSDYMTLVNLKDLLQKRICLGSDQSPSDRHVQPVRDACRPLVRDEALEVVWSLYPPKASDVEARKSRWIRPVVQETEAWSLLDDRILTQTDFRTCLKLVIEARLKREGVVAIPSNVRAGVEEVSNAEEAMEKIEKYLLERKAEKETKKIETTPPRVAV
ncbi:uncharacterized protein [Haliotis cracherodii]|uniref:uncharacterized protein isoform X1 n=1 Tax=Haliotis cracherodii TaxID=6455 RepID=UPI0039EA0FC0